ncbi:MAG: tetratricopeptide repeat protein [Candidatus Tectomicrobia bacterium]|nr:tetratricopeptide repeat protein [Candidatus Tectomicrobia bacterium]
MLLRKSISFIIFLSLFPSTLFAQTIEDQKLIPYPLSLIPQPSTLNPQPLSLFAQITEDPEKLLGFADSLFSEGEYYRAITEYKRFLFYYSGHPLAPYALYRVGLSYFRGEEWEKAIVAFREVHQEYRESEFAQLSLFMVGESFYNQRNYEASIEAYQEVIKVYEGEEVAERSRYKIGWSYIQRKQWREATEAFSTIPSGSRYYPSAIELAKEVKEGEELPQKSPLLSGLFSAFLPGSGQFYTGRKRDGTASFLLNASFLAAAITALKKGNDGAAGVLLFFEAGWYVGNIYGAVNSAHKFNLDRHRQFLNDLQRKHQLFLQISEKFDGVILGYRFEF